MATDRGFMTPDLRGHPFGAFVVSGSSGHSFGALADCTKLGVECTSFMSLKSEPGGIVWGPSSSMEERAKSTEKPEVGGGVWWTLEMKAVLNSSGAEVRGAA